MTGRKITPENTTPNKIAYDGTQIVSAKKIQPNMNQYDDFAGDSLSAHGIPDTYNDSRFVCSKEEVGTDMAYQTISQSYSEYQASAAQSHIADNMAKLARVIIKKMAMVGVPYHLVMDNVLDMIDELYIGVNLNAFDRSNGSVRDGLMNYMRSYLSCERTGDEVLATLLTNDWEMQANFQKICVDELSLTYSELLTEIPGAFKTKHQNTSIGKMIESHHLENAVDMMGHGGIQTVYFADSRSDQSLVDKVRGMVIANYFGPENIATLPSFNGNGCALSSFFNRMMSPRAQAVNTQLEGLIGLMNGGDMYNKNNGNMIQQYQPGQQQSGYPQGRNGMMQNPNGQMGMQQYQQGNMRVEVGSFSLNKHGMSFTAMESNYDQYGNMIGIEGVTINESNGILGVPQGRQSIAGPTQQQIPSNHHLSADDILNGNFPGANEPTVEDDGTGLILFSEETDEEVEDGENHNEYVSKLGRGNIDNVENADFEILD